MTCARSLAPSLLVSAVFLTAGTAARAQSVDSAPAPAPWRFVIGGRSTIMVTDMRLGQLDPAHFADLVSGGGDFAHSSGLFVLFPKGRHVHLGVETLVGNSYGSSDVSMLFQAVGFSAEYSSRGPWLVSAGLLAGAVIATATRDTAPAGQPEVSAGYHYKGSGLFVAPTLGVGRLLGRTEIKLVARIVMNLPGSENLDAFDAGYLGLSLGLRR